MIFPIVDLFLTDYQSTQSQKYVSQILTRFRLWLDGQKIENVGSIKRLHLTQYCRTIIDPCKVRKKTKSRYYQVIRKYLGFLFENDLIPAKIEITPPRFADHIRPGLIKKYSVPIPTKLELVSMLKFVYKFNPKMFIYLGILFHNGLRDSECRSIKIEHIDLNLHRITTGIIDEHKKRGLSYYYFHPSFKIHLQKYITTLQNTYTQPDFLFHSINSKTGFITHSSIEKQLKNLKEQLGLSCRVNPHVFRDVLNEYRMSMGCNDSLMAILLNQTPRGTNALYYLKMIVHNPQTRQEYWKKFTWDLLPEATLLN